MPMAMILYCDDRIARFVGKTPSKEEAEYLDYRH